MTPFDPHALARVEAKLDLILEQLPDHENRLRGLERFRSRALGATAPSTVTGGWTA